MEKTDFLQTLEGDLCKVTGKPVEVILTDDNKVEVTPPVPEAPVIMAPIIVDTTCITKTAPLTPIYTDHRPGKNRGPQEPKYTHKQYQKARTKKRKARRKGRR